ncbi:MAG TPA: alpha/beta fold hydrolase [Longimicrobiales bacterium]
MRRDRTGRGGAGVLEAMAALLATSGVEAASRWSAVSGVRLHHLEAGGGPPLVLLHGAGGGAANWYGIIGLLARRFRIFALDLPGFGLSEPIEPRFELGRQIAEIVDTWSRGLGVERFHVCGTSFGGLVALRLAQRRSDAVRRLAVIDAAGLGPDVSTVVRLAGLRLLGPILLRPSRRGTAWLLRRVLTAGRPLDPAVEPALVEYLFRSAEAGDRAILARAYRLFAGRRGQREVLGDAELAALRMPTLVLWGRRDAFFPPAHAERAAAVIPQATLKWIDAAGHSPNWEAPQEVADALLEFFADPAGAA